MLKKLTLLTAIATGFTSNIGAMDDQTPMHLQPNIAPNQTLQTYNAQQKTILDTLKNEAKLTAVAAGCHTATLYAALVLACLSGKHCGKIPESGYLVLDLLTSRIVNIPLIAAGGILAGKHLTYKAYDAMDPKEEHNVAHAVGFAVALSNLIFGGNTVIKFLLPPRQ